MKNRDNQQELPAIRTKKTYQRPQLQVYGDLRDITQNVGTGGAKDGSGKSTQKTH